MVRHAGISDAAAELTLVEEQRITGADVPGSPGFTRIYSTTPAADDGVLVYDQGARALIEFDPTGRYRRAIGRFGKGPGEHTSFHSLIIAPDGHYYFGEISGGHIFSPTGEYERSWPRLNR